MPQSLRYSSFKDYWYTGSPTHDFIQLKILAEFFMPISLQLFWKKYYIFGFFAWSTFYNFHTFIFYALLEE